MKNIAIFASGNGSNADKIIEYSHRDRNPFHVSVIITNNPNAGVIDVANKWKVPHFVINKDFHIETALEMLNVELVVLAGFLWRVPEKIWSKFRTINIHPSLLPKYGGKGMYGHHVHRAVLESDDTISGITVHFVNGEYDDGSIIYSAVCPVQPLDTITALERRVQVLEHKYYPMIIEETLKLNVDRRSLK